MPDFNNMKKWNTVNFNLCVLSFNISQYKDLITLSFTNRNTIRQQ